MTRPRGDHSDRTTVRRIPHLAVTDRGVLEAILDAALVAHVGIVDDGQPYVLPMACARDDDKLLLHGSTASRLMRHLDSGQPVCATVTLLDGVVVARSAFNSSMNYRSAMVLGIPQMLDGEQKARALEVLTDHLTPGRRSQARPTRDNEMRATTVAALPLTEWSVKARSGPPDDPDEDRDLPLWAGVVPLAEGFAEPETDPSCPPGVDVPDYVMAWRR
jgi:uncharacterized protein